MAHHDHPAIVNSVPGWVDIGYDIFSASYEDFSLADCILISGTDPFESKTVAWNEWIVQGINANKTNVIMAVPRRTQGVAYAEANGGLWLDLFPGSDTAVHLAIARIILENGWEDKDFIRDWTNNQWETDSGFGQGTRNTPWQWRTTWGKLQTKGFEDWKKWIYNQPESDPHAAAKLAGLDVKKLYRAAEMMAKPRADGSRPKTSIGIEKGNYWSNNYLNTASIGNLGVIVGAGGRPGRVVTRLGGHQRGGRSGGRYPGIKSPYKFPGRRRHRMDLDRWLDAGHVRFAYCVGTTWVQAMCGTSSIEEAFRRLVKQNPHQVSTLSKQGVVDTLKKRTDSGGTVVVNQEIYPVDPIGTQYADIVLPAATWGEENFTRSNGERRIRLYQKFYDPPGEAKPDWQIVAMFAKKMGFEGYDWKDSNDVFEESCRFSRGSRTDYNALRTMAKRKGMKAHDFLKTYGTQGLQCPLLLDGDTIVETKRLHDFNRKLPATGPEGATVVNKALTAFKTQTGKLNLMKTPWNIWSDFYEFVKPREDELWVGNGRINEVWQSGFDDVERRPYITQRWPFNFLEIHPDDAQPRGIESGDLVSVESQRVPVQTDFNMGVKSDDMWFSGLMKRGHIKLSSGQFTAVAIVTSATKKGVVYTNHLDKKQPANALAPRVPDPLTMNYRFKMMVGKVIRLGESPLARLDGEPDPDVRMEIVEALGTLGAQEAVDTLIVTLHNDPDEDVRLQACHALGQLPSPRAIEALIDCLTGQVLSDMMLWESDDDIDFGVVWELQREALDGLGKIGDARAVEAMVQFMAEAGRDDLEALGLRGLGRLGGERAVGFVLGQLRQGGTLTRCRAARALAIVDAPMSQPALIDALADREREVRLAAGWALSTQDCDAAVPHLEVLLRDSDATVRLEALSMLAISAAARVTESLLHHLDDPQLEVQLRVIQILEDRGEQRAIAPMLLLLAGIRTDDVLTAALIRALGVLKARAALAPVCQLLEDGPTRSIVRLQAALALGDIAPGRLPDSAVGGDANQEPWAADSQADPIKHLSILIQDADPQVCRAAQLSLDKLGWVSDSESERVQEGEQETGHETPLSDQDDEPVSADYPTSTLEAIELASRIASSQAAAARHLEAPNTSRPQLRTSAQWMPIRGSSALAAP